MGSFTFGVKIVLILELSTSVFSSTNASGTKRKISSNIEHYSTTLNFDVLPLVEIDHVTRYFLSSAGAYQRVVPVFGNFRSNFSFVQ